jgi:hypothetical protein
MFNIEISDKEANFIYETFGKIINYDISLTLDVLVTTIKNLIHTYQVKSKLSSHLVFPQKDAQRSDLNPLDVVDLLPSSLAPAVSSTVQIITYVLYHTVYCITLVVDSNELQCDINAFKHSFPEFECIIQSPEVAGMNETVKATFKQVFHKQVFDEKEDINEKYKAFKNLYNLVEDNKEKNTVRTLLDWNYETSTDMSQKIKANDLYDFFVKNLNIDSYSVASFKKRLSKYLSDFGFVKKRLSDAYYFCGIERKSQNYKNIDDFEEKRNAEVGIWFPKYGEKPIDVNSAFEKMLSERT